ncbi:uncharacterized protein LOC131284745 [Anopheles ziemanni]|uniref:uncharacterized protein LOC131261273 n=1 Tax=Anopheles coustani TaxID=139045 RepID=UPI0026592E1B|nr:uncharacterized protein LOC131261273 [Anopheles coustani]XP_058169589.1 uncharacterized protein LOC131284745 [Anopheles ziemanni]
MCSRNCYRVSGYFLGFLWMVSAVYYTAETIELLKLMKLRCETGSTSQGPGGVTARMQFDEELTQKACSFYAHLDVFWPYHVITTIIKMTPGFLLVLGIYKNNATLVVVFAVYGFLEECFFVIVFSKIFAIMEVGSKSIWIYWIIVIFSVKLFASVWILLGVYAAVQPFQIQTTSRRTRTNV